MPLLESDSLLKRFNDLLVTATHVDIAVAWVGPSLAVDSLLNHADDARIRIVVGLSGNSTEPTTLRRFLAEENIDLRVAPAPRGGLFHPKFYRFRSRERTVCWIGSANFTRGGFGGNAELVHEFRDRKERGRDWFEVLWAELDEDPEPAIVDYEKHYRPPKPGGYRSGKTIRRRDLPRLQDIRTWDDFVAGLEKLDDYCHQRRFGWDVLGDTYSYLHTIGVGREVARRGNWKDFTRRDRNVLLGLGHWDKTGAWGLLGNMRNARAAVSAFTPPGNSAIRSRVSEHIQDVVDAEEDEIGEAAHGAVAGIRELHRFGPGVATRALTLARPDLLVSVNEPSKAGLGAFARMTPDEGYLADNYRELLAKLHDTGWCKAPEPGNARDREIWLCRVALVDAFVYVPLRTAV